MKFLHGLYTDSVAQDTPEGAYVFAKNIVDGNIIGSKENEDGFVAAGTLAPYTVIGIAVVGIAFVVFSTDNTHSEIGLVTRNGTALTYTAIYNNSALNFNTAHPIIDTEYRIDVNNQRTIAWTDNFNVPRLLNIDNLSAISGIQDLNIFQDINNPALSSAINDSGGALKTGSIIIITKYKNNLDNAETNWFIHDHVFYINKGLKSASFNTDDGSDSGLITSKSMSLTFIGCDTRYNTIEIGYIMTTGGITTAVNAVSVTNASTVNFTLTGNETTTTITLDEVLVATTSYNTAATLTQLAGRLFLGNLTASAIPALQQAALSATVTWNSSLVTIPTNVNNHKDNLPPTLLPGEVYALYLGVELNLGGWRLYHIPGRAPAGNERDAVSNEGMNYTRFQVENSASGGPTAGSMGYWENSNENYPTTSDFNGSIDLRGLPVRHHRMPNLSYLTQLYSGTTNLGINQLPYLSLTVSNINIPAGIQSQIKRWKIFYAKKSDGDKLILGSDLLMHPAIPAADTSTRWSSGGNWITDSNHQSSGSNVWQSFSSIDTAYIRGHSLDYIYNKTLPTPTYAEFPYQLQRYITSNDAASTIGANPIVDFSGFGSNGTRVTTTGPIRGKVAGAVLDYTLPGTFLSTKNLSLSGIKRLDNFTYLPQNAQVSIGGVSHKSEYTEGSFVAGINNSIPAWTTPITLVTRGMGAGDTSYDETFHGNTVSTPATETTMLMLYCKLLSSVHNSFMSQMTIPLEGYASPATTSQTFTGGDGFLCYLSFLAAAPICSNPDTGQVGSPSTEGVRIWRGYVGYSRMNFNYRQQTIGDTSTYYYGKTDPRTLYSPTVTTLANNPGYIGLLDSNTSIGVVQYNTDYNVLNEFNSPVVFSPTLVQEAIFPNTVIFSPVQSEESKATSWRTFLSGDRYVLAKNKGQLINLQGLNNRQLLLHTEFSLFRTRTDVQMSTQNNAENVFLQSAGLFTLPPEEVIPVTSGYAGTQNRQSCRLTKAGYFFIDNNQGKCFLYSGDLQEISSNGLRNFFKDFTNITPSDNAFIGNGFTVGYDERSNRLLISKNADPLSWTLSYNTLNKYWVSYHDYIPDHMWDTVDNVLYSVKDNRFYIHNVLNNTQVKGVFYGATVNSSYIDLPFNKFPTEDKLFSSINWMTQLYPNSYTNGQPNSTLFYTQTFTHITVRGLDHCTGRVALVPENDFYTLYTSNLRNLNRTWHFNNIRDILTGSGFLLGFYSNYTIDPTKLDTNPAWYNERRFIDKFVICRLEYDNTGNNRCILVDADIEITPVTR